MKQLFALLLCLSAAASSTAQCPVGPPQVLSPFYEYINTKFRNSLQIPRHPAGSTCRDTGQLYYNPIDSAIYWHTGTQYRTFSGQAYYNNSGSMLSMDSNYDAQFMVEATAIIYASNPYVLNDTIQWRFLQQTSNHAFSFYDSAKGDPVSLGLRVYYPTVKNVLNTTLTGDEVFSRRTTFEGTSTDLTNLLANMYVQVPVGIQLTGNGGSSWSTAGAFPSYFTFSAITSGATALNVTSTAAMFTNYEQMTCTYVGSNNYHVRQIYAGLGSYNLAFILVNNATGADVTTNPTSADVVLINNAGVTSNPINLLTYDANNAFVAATNVNLWLRGIYEVWMTAKYLTSTTSYIRWQLKYPSATTYKIYRANAANFSDQVLIHTGNEGNYTDTGLTAERTYHYKLVAVVGGVDTPVSTFTISPH